MRSAAHEIHEIVGDDLTALARVGEQLAAGALVIVRRCAAINRLREEIITYAASYDGRITAGDDLLRFYEEGRPLDLRGVAALAAAIRATRTSCFVPQLFAPLIRQLGFGASTLVHTGVSRLVLASGLVEQARLSPAFTRDDFTREFSYRPTEVFMAQPSNIHRDFNREHSVLQCNLWFPLHDAGADDVVQIYPGVYRLPVFDMPNTPDNRRELPAAARIALGFGDAVLFHGEHLHHSPDAQERGRRHSYDLRVASSAYDDNRHYAADFFDLNNFATDEETRPSLAGSQAEAVAAPSRSTPAIAFWQHAVQAPSLERAQARALAAGSALYPFAADRAVGLAECIGTLDADAATTLLQEVVERTPSCFWALKAATALAQLGDDRRARLGCARALELSATPAPNFAPVSYPNPALQLMPADIGRLAAAALGEPRR